MSKNKKDYYCWDCGKEASEEELPKKEWGCSKNLGKEHKWTPKKSKTKQGEFMKTFKLSKIKTDRLLSFALYLKDGGEFNIDKLSKKYIKFFSDIEKLSAIRTLTRDIKILKNFKLIK